MRLLKVLLPVLCGICAQAQQLQFTNISSSLPLPSQECYNITQDSKGYIWFSTEAGLCKYNGNSLEIFDKKNGLPEGGVYAVAEDEKGTLWFATSKNRILNYTGGALREAPFSKALQRELAGTLQLSYLLNFKTDGRLCINTAMKAFEADVSSNTVTQQYKPDTSAHFYLFRTPRGLVPVNGERTTILQNFERRAIRGYVKIIIDDNGKRHEIRLPYDNTKYPYWRILAAHTAEADFFSFEQFVFKLNKDLSFEVYEQPDRIISLYCDKSEGLWVGVRKNGVCYYPDPRNMQRKLLNLQEYSVSGICEDHEKGIWCTTLEKGVFYCHNKSIVTYSNVAGLQKRALLLKYEHGRILASSRDNELVEITSSGSVGHKLSLDGIHALADALKLDKGWIIGAADMLGVTDENFTLQKKIRYPGSKFTAGAYQVVCAENRRWFVMQFSGVTEIVNDEVIPRSITLESPGNCLCYDEGRLLLGCKENLYEMDTGTYACKRIGSVRGNVQKIIAASNGQVWIAMRNAGLYTLRGDSLVSMNEQLRMGTDRFNDVTEDQRGTIWTTSNAGLFKIVPQGNSYAWTLYNSANGFPSNEVYKVAADEKNVYFSTEDGLCSFSLDAELNNSTPPPVHLQSLSVSGRPVPLSGVPLVFAHDENSCELSFDALTFKDKTVRLAWRFANGDSLEFSEGDRLVLRNLDPGAYELQVYAVNNDGVLSKDPAVLKFEIGKPFWVTAWFITCCIGALLLLIALVIKLIARAIRRKEEKQTRINKLIAEYQLSALQAQMNPHFIFNAINSIQGYILRRSEQEAYDYLAKFSKLIRMVLVRSQENVVPLKQELEMLTLYVQLEQMRFDESFGFELRVDERVDAFNVYVPNMLIQPYVENAIWHGLMNLGKGKKGRLEIGITASGGLLKIAIEDNGVGRELAKAFRKKDGHEPAGMKLNGLRMEMINTLQDYKTEVQVVDLYDEKKNPCGTRVEITIDTD